MVDRELIAERLSRLKETYRIIQENLGDLKKFSEYIGRYAGERE